MSPAGGNGTRIVAQGREDVSHFTAIYQVAPDYFRVAGIALVTGRTFDQRDVPFLWPNQPAVGQRLRSGTNAPWTTVIGVVSPIKTGFFTLQSADFQMYRPASQSSLESAGLLVRANGDRAATFQSIRSVMKGIDPGLDLAFPRSVDGDYERSLMSPRFYFVLMTLLGVLGVGTALIGLYASSTHAVSQRTREIGIRLALGADRNRMTRDIVLAALGPAVGGAIGGLLVAYWLGQYVSALLYQTDPRDPWTLAGAAILLLTATALGALIPARRASRIDPATTLRAE
jgi:ABC-type antimicrobial peptide transport system permease subunit